MSDETIDLASATARMSVSSSCFSARIDRFPTRAGHSPNNFCNTCANLALTRGFQSASSLAQTLRFLNLAVRQAVRHNARPIVTTITQAKSLATLASLPRNTHGSTDWFASIFSNLL